MLVRYKHMSIKPKGAPLVVPFESRKNASSMALAKIIWANPYAELPDRDAKLYVQADPHNFEIVNEGSVPEKLESAPQGVELHDDRPKPKKRGRKPKALEGEGVSV